MKLFLSCMFGHKSTIILQLDIFFKKFMFKQ
jgi:hypothetical protein